MPRTAAIRALQAATGRVTLARHFVADACRCGSWSFTRQKSRTGAIETRRCTACGQTRATGPAALEVVEPGEKRARLVRPD